ncbi:MAG: HypC/HybG/HupF family hydrogenase formation chaperone [Actinomycetota bacterium]|nr:HypC/HybG/HupF family hydrogenase formation chaperone [Actinomycetota bacterium]
MTQAEITVSPSSAQTASDVLGGLSTDLADAALALATRFAAGATLWCQAPQWPAHAHHVAVEFVHPVIVGKKALPAVVVPAHEPVGSLRVLARPGDVLLAVADATDPAVAETMLRAAAWGLETIWIGAGPRPASGLADHVLWLDHGGDQAPHTGELVLLYHVLWELTHVCFEHSGLLESRLEDAVCATDPENRETCITCSDEGRVAEVVSVGPDSAVVRAGGRLEEADVTLVAPVGPGDVVLVHAGTAISRLGTDS